MSAHVSVKLCVGRYEKTTLERSRTLLNYLRLCLKAHLTRSSYIYLRHLRQVSTIRIYPLIQDRIRRN